MIKQTVLQEGGKKCHKCGNPARYLTDKSYKSGKVRFYQCVICRQVQSEFL